MARTLLLTGFTAPQCGSSRVNGVNHVPGALREAARRAGYEVEHRVVAVGEDVARYDAVVVSLMTLLSLTSSYALGALWTLARRRDAVIVVDDWQVASIAGQFTMAARRLDYYLTSPRVLSAAKRPGVDAIRRRRSAERRAIFEEVERLAVTWEPHPVAAPVFAWGDVRRLELPTGCPLAFDPSPFVTRYDPAPSPARARRRRWVLASLFDHSRWLAEHDFRWPVARFGRGGEARLAERDVVAEYAVSWGVLGHAYKHVASGWWRPRFLHAVAAGSIIYGERAELELVAPGFWAPLAEIEGASTSKLEHLARCQRDALEARLWDAHRLVRFTRNLLKGEL